MVSERPTDGCTDLDIKHDPDRLAAHPPSGDRPHLAGYDHAGSRLACLTRGDGHVSWVSRLIPGGRDGAHGHESRAVERFVRDDERSALASLLMTLHRVEVHDHDRPA